MAAFFEAGTVSGATFNSTFDPNNYLWIYNPKKGNRRINAPVVLGFDPARKPTSATEIE